MQATHTDNEFERTDFTLPKIDKHTYPLDIVSGGRCKLNEILKHAVTNVLYSSLISESYNAATKLDGWHVWS